LLLVLQAAEVPQNLLKARIITDHLWHKNEILRATSMAWHPRFTTIGWASERELRR
jgi:hypothetical protein